MLTLLSYLRGFIMTPFAVLWTLFLSVLVILFTGFGCSKETFFYLIKNVWSKVILTLSGVEVEVRGTERLPSGGFLYIFNHTSHFDILTMFVATPRVCYFGAKAELFSIPIFNTAIKAGGALRIERSNRAKVMEVYKEAEARVAKGDVFALAPEGTRQKGFGFLGPFKTGPFYFSVNAKMPIVPVILVGCEKVLGKKDIFPNLGHWKQKVIFECLDPIYPQPVAGEAIDVEVKRLRDVAFEKMSQRLKEYWG